MQKIIVLARLIALFLELAGPQTGEGRVKSSFNRQIGLGQTRPQLDAGVRPIARITNRIANRFQSWIKSSIERIAIPVPTMEAAFAAAPVCAEATNR